jgi:nitrate/nitrite-specific signal transduction histidine kinase
MRERILPFGGALQFTSAPGQGTTVVAKVTLEQESKDQAIGHDG